MQKSTHINGYHVLVEDEDTDSLQCWVCKDRAQASLACLQQTGALTHEGTFDDVPVNSDDIDKITEWAEANGY